MMENAQDGISIGALSKATGISIHSLRMWERRYGAPEAIRRPSGHRRYPYEEVARLRAVSRALAMGFRAGEVAPLSLDEINTMIDALQEDLPQIHPGEPLGTGSPEERIHQWILAAREFDEYRLDREFLDGWNYLGPLHFLTRMASPFLRELGDCWQSGAVKIANEHFASEKICDFLAARWRALHQEATHGTVVVAGLPGEQHRAPLLMCAVTAACARHRVLYLGGGTPARELASACANARAEAVCLSISPSIPARAAVRHLGELDERLPTSLPVVTGGSGAPSPTSRILRLEGFPELYDWLRRRQEATLAAT